MKRFRKFDISVGGWIFLLVIYLLLDGELMVSLLINAAIHELGHLYALKRFGAYVRRIEFGFGGLCILCNTLYLPNYAVFLSAAAGPLAGVASAVLFSFVGNVMQKDSLLLYAGTGLLLSLFNLIPAKPLDGWRMVCAVWPQYAREVSVLSAIFILILGLLLLYNGYGSAMAVVGIVLLLQDLSDCCVPCAA